MGVYGYCVVPRDHVVPPGMRGLDGAEIRGHGIDDLMVVVSESERPEPNAEHVQQHNAAIEGLVTQDVTPVPLRFGQWAAEIEVFEKAVGEKAEWYRERLKVFAGALEFGLRILQPDKASPARDVRVPHKATGLEYMKALQDRAATERAATADVEEVRAAISEIFGALVREERVEQARTPHGVIAVSHLVARHHFDEYRQDAQRLRTRFPDKRFLVSGPWMPYSFAT